MDLSMMNMVMERLKTPDVPLPAPDPQADINDVAMEHKLFEAMRVTVEASVKTITRYVNQIAISRVLSDDDANVRGVIIEAIERSAKDWGKIIK